MALLASMQMLHEPQTQILLCSIILVLFIVTIFAHAFLGSQKLLSFLPESLQNYARFCYGCFIKPHEGRGTRDQKVALESFYKAQASVYDNTRTRLLRGREDMLGLVAAQIRHRVKQGIVPQKPIWVDMGGGTGYNVEQMQRFVDVPNFFDRVFIIDLSPSLLAVAADRFKRLGWKNVHVICQDARHFRLEDHYQSPLRAERYGEQARNRPDLITMSYSLSMIPDFYSVVDSLANTLSENGVIGVADFYVQSEIDYHSRNYIGGEINRHCMWISRVFWRTWFEVDRVSLEAARRDYLEYRFGTILSFNARNRMLGLRIPYYVWIGCSRDTGVSQAKLRQLDAAATESPFISALDRHGKSMQETKETREQGVRSKAYDSAVVNLASSLPLPSSWYQQHHWRIHFDEHLQKHRQFGNEYIYAFTWEDAHEDLKILDIQKEDVILAITSAGDNALTYALKQPKRIHCVDLNPNQNHLLELKLAAFTALGHGDIWKLFGDGKHDSFREILITKLSPHLSSLSFQYWLQYGPETFANHGLYFTGGSRHALNLVQWLFSVLGLKKEIERLCSAKTMDEQLTIWRRSVRRVLLNRLLSWAIVSNKTWLWKALGVPEAQRQMIEQDFARQSGDAPPLTSPVKGMERSENAETYREAAAARAAVVGPRNSGRAIWNYALNTLDPVVENTLISDENHYYLLTLLGRYTKRCHPPYLDARAHAKLSRPGALDGMRIHTDEVREVLARMQPGTLTIAVVMDSMDWFEPGSAELDEQVQLIRQALRVGGRLMLRSAGTHPWYISAFEKHGFQATRVAVRNPGTCIDRVNMYASTWICTKLSNAGDDVVSRMEPLNIGKPMQVI
ncbi:betaine lipid synthase [Xylona heveae TC161]|uniref:Betaine lipid synthase n=1 Tax=Xylona heveae (strain CBS 132557 / TC161) TaxID=1328760 RepID=A0A165ABK9_XYLHT|nr:betaine lipid synthase [Xylona heveae TC161]KZF20217.1 betaine lipid synthase [Xylona heveae TC161]